MGVTMILLKEVSMNKDMNRFKISILKLKKGEFVLFSGKSGSGKSTLWKCKWNGLIPHYFKRQNARKSLASVVLLYKQTLLP